jgi:DNA-binding beta-propeller fold protein YncE
MRQSKKWIGIFFSLLAPTCVNAAPDFGLDPITPTVMLLPQNSSAQVRYTVTNNTQITRQITMTPIAGVTQVTLGGGVCANPFTLTPGQSCTLILQVLGSQIPARINGGPVVCKTKSPTDNTPDPFLCSQPALVNRLNVTAIAAIPDQKIYVSNWFGDSVTLCTVNTLDGTLQGCFITASGAPTFSNPEAVTVNPTGTLFYVANIGGSSVSFCEIDSSTGGLSNCALTGGLFNGADGIVLNKEGTLAYVSNAGSNSVSMCDVDSTSGALSGSCTSTGGPYFGPSDMTLDGFNLNAYVSNVLSGTVSICSLDSNGLFDCSRSVAGFNQPEGITLHPTGNFAYITNNGSNNVSVCQVRYPDGYLHSCKITNGNFNGFGNLAFNNLGSRAYVPNMLTQRVYVCSVNLNNGDLFDCIDAGGALFFNGPSGVLLR